MILTVERLESGFYKVTLADGTSFIGGAASTIIVLATHIFKKEAQDV